MNDCSTLGRPTRRGIKKCPKCGTYNGTRGLICKNKLCDAVFKDYADKRKINLDAVRLSGLNRQIYSVRVADRGVDHRGFVQLPLSDDKNILSENALCLIDSCQRIFDDSFLKYQDVEQTDSSLLCPHIESALKSQSIGTAVDIRNDILTGLKVPKEVRTELCLLALEKEGPLVQRVSRTVMVVKCQVTPKHPLGFLHFSFGCSKGREIYDKFYCSCTDFTGVGSKCLHYYACISALASDPKYSLEFSNILSYDVPVTQPLSNIHKKLYPVPCTNMKQTHATRPHRVKKNARATKSKMKLKKILPHIVPVEIKVLDSTEEHVESLSWRFSDWLMYVTESINQTMEFENYGIINTLMFCIPPTFWDEFRKRIPAVYVQEEPFALLSIQRYSIMNILHVKEIFDTPEVKLKISKRFYRDLQEEYVEYDENHDGEVCQSDFIFFLNVGQSTVDESDNVNNAFIIDWIPSSCTITKIGQLKIQYKYGRKNTA